MNDNEDLNLSQIQNKDQYFEENLEEHLDEKISSAKKEYFEFSESDKDLKQLQEDKGNEGEDIEPKQLNEHLDVKDDSVPGKNFILT